MAASCQQSPESKTIFTHTISSGATPWSHGNFQESDSAFTFAIITDLNGGERDRVFEVAVAQLNLLNPEMVLSIGDLIDGGTEDINQLEKEWKSFDDRANKLNAPFFHIGGNHDLTNQVMRDVWAAKHGPRYYHFVYKNTLFLMIDSEDFSSDKMREVYEARAYALGVIARDRSEYPETKYYAMPERRTGAISIEQSTYFEQVIANNPNVRWTFLFMHKPSWQREDEKGLGRIEAALSNRNYTVFNGHLHVYDHVDRNGQDYITLGTTGGGQDPNNAMAFDHITLVSLADQSPIIANLRLDGILNKKARIPLNGDTLNFQASAKK
jgi:hypothetical protein